MSVHVALLLIFFVIVPATPALAQVRPVEFDDVEGCKSLGEITGKTGVCSLGRARANAMKHATQLGATHIVWTNARCVLFAGHRAQGEMFDCNQRESSADRRGPAQNALGIHATLIPEAERQKLKRNTGAYVTAVDDESPAFFANIVAGDVVIAAGDRDVAVPRDLATVRPGVILTVLRDGEELSIDTAR